MSRIPFLAAAAAVLLSSAPLQADSLGLGYGRASLGAQSEAGMRPLLALDGVMDFAITGHHGLQIDLGYAETGPAGEVGSLAFHLYMSPDPSLRYGFFATVADRNDASDTWGAVGAEAIWSVGAQTSIGAHGGIGMRRGDLDYIFAGLDLETWLSDSLALTAGASVARFDEAGFDATGIEAHLGLRYHMQDSPAGLYAEIRQEELNGPSGRPSRTSLHAGVFIEFGGRAARPAARPFRVYDPVRQLVRRGL